ncbi:MAG: hypothetical protein K2O91_00935 [Lachnospiraceae bacterium]|nr:hypothetical protein [Lachnospiraceae bacterium]
MNDLQTQITNYLEYCQNQKRLDAKTLMVYRIDLTQFFIHIQTTDISEITPEISEKFIVVLHQKYMPKTIPLHTVETFLSTIYRELSDAKTDYRKRL